MLGGANFEPLSLRVRVAYNLIFASLGVVAVLVALSDSPSWACPFFLVAASTAYVKVAHAACRRKGDRSAVAADSYSKVHTR